MKIINKKGITIIELIVTIALISIIMLFLYALLSNITFESDNEFIDIVDRTTREDIIRTINDTIDEYNEDINIPNEKAANYEATRSVSGDNITTTTKIKKIDGTVLYTITTTNKTLTFTDNTSGKVIQKWELTNGKFTNAICDSKGNTDTNNSVKLVTCSIKVSTGNINNKELSVNSSTVDNNNVLDDITFTFGNIPITLLDTYNLITFNNDGGDGKELLKVLIGQQPASVEIPTKSGSTFGGYYTNTAVTSLTNAFVDYRTYGVLRIETKNDSKWHRNSSDANRFFQASFTIEDTNLYSAPTQIEFNDYQLVKDGEYKVTKLSDHKWQYDIALNLNSAMVSKRGIYDYDTDYRFIDIEGVTTAATHTVKYIYLDDGRYYDENGDPLVFKINNNITLKAKW